MKESTQELILQALLLLIGDRKGRQAEVLWDKIHDRIEELQRERDPQGNPDHECSFCAEVDKLRTTPR